MHPGALRFGEVAKGLGVKKSCFVIFSSNSFPGEMRWAERPSCATVDVSFRKRISISHTHAHAHVHTENTNLQSLYLSSLFTITRPHCFLSPFSLSLIINQSFVLNHHHTLPLPSFHLSFPPSSLPRFLRVGALSREACACPRLCASYASVG